MTIPYNQPFGPEQVFGAPGTINLPAPAYPGQLCWYAISAASSPEIAWGASDDGIIAGAGILGPFRVASAPRHVVSGTCTILVLLS